MAAPELTPSAQRFRVVELQGWPVTPYATRPWRVPGLSVSVLDSAYCWREVGRWATNTSRHSRAYVRGQAESLAAELNAAE